MNLIVLAAGKGDRMGLLTRDKPKLLLNLDGITLLERQLKSINEAGVIDKIIYVVGHRAEAIEEKLKKLNYEAVITVFNPFYDISNNLISLWLAKHYMDTDFAITNGDNLFEASVLRKLCLNRDGIYLATNKKDTYTNDDMKVTLKGGNIKRVSKFINGDEVDCESVGLVVVSGKKSIEVFRNTLEKLARSKDYLDKYWLEVFNTLTKDNVVITPCQIEGKWQEFDYHGDIEQFLKGLDLPKLGED